VYKEFPLGYTPYSENWAWDLVSSQQKIYSLWDESRILHYPSESNTGNVIGFDGERTQGAAVFRPEGSLTVTKIINGITIDDRYFLEAVENSVNDSAWFDYNAGEVLYTGARIRRRSDSLIQLDLQFLISRTKPAVDVTMYDDEVINVEVRPWDYIWFQYIDTANLVGTDTVLAKRIKSIHVAQVYEYVNFDLFGLGGPYG
jgi:hypothetical protein